MVRARARARARVSDSGEGEGGGGAAVIQARRGGHGIWTSCARLVHGGVNLLMAVSQVLAICAAAANLPHSYVAIVLAGLAFGDLSEVSGGLRARIKHKLLTKTISGALENLANKHSARHRLLSSSAIYLDRSTWVQTTCSTALRATMISSLAWASTWSKQFTARQAPRRRHQLLWPRLFCDRIWS